MVQEDVRGLASIRALGRLAVFAVGSWLVVARALGAVLAPFPDRWRRSCPHVSRWSRLGRRCLGIRVEVEGALPSPGALVVANHQGYVDIVALGSLFPSIFAARHDMRRWPMFGALAASGATLFINRDNKRAGARGVGQVAAALAAGATVIAFPEGTSTDGTGLLPFRTGIFQAAVDSGAPVVPAGIRYRDIDGVPVTEANRHVVGWFRGESFVVHMLRLGARRRVSAVIRLGGPVSPAGLDRRALAALCETRVRELAGLGEGAPALSGRGAAARREAS